MCSWNQPAEDQRNGEIISYALICTTDGETVIDITLNPSATEITLDLFAPLTSYSCSVAASTAVGIGPYTTPINVTTEGTHMWCIIIIIYPKNSLGIILYPLCIIKSGLNLHFL